MKNTHRFTVTVCTDKTKAQAETAVLLAFANRQPDDCSFHLTDLKVNKLMAEALKDTKKRLAKAQRDMARFHREASALAGLVGL